MKESVGRGIDFQEQLARCLALFRERKPDWHAFADANIEGYRRAQHRYIGPGASGKEDPKALRPGSFTLSVMYVPRGQGNAAHTHEVEEVFFVLKGHVTVFFEDGNGYRVESVLGPWDCVSCPAGVIHGYVNDGLEDVWVQVMLGKAVPDLMGYTDPELARRRDEHLRAGQG